MHALRIPHFLLLLTSTFLALDAPTPAQAFGLGSLREDLLPLWPRSAGLERRINITNNNDEDPADWVIQDVYSGVDFFESVWIRLLGMHSDVPFGLAVRVIGIFSLGVIQLGKPFSPTFQSLRVLTKPYFTIKTAGQ
jgi:hypothetical protein